MQPHPTTTGFKNAIDEQIRQHTVRNPDSILQALSFIRWIAAGQDGSNETAMQSLSDIEDLATEALAA